MYKLPISEYPEVLPPSAVAHAQYRGANPKVIAETVARRSNGRSTKSRTNDPRTQNNLPSTLLVPPSLVLEAILGTG